MVTPPERREVDTMMRQAGVRPTINDGVVGSPVLADVFGARTPSGIPVPEAPKPAQQPRAGGGRRSSGGRGRSSGGGQGQGQGGYSSSQGRGSVGGRGGRRRAA
jgi:hypothetical protein